MVDLFILWCILLSEVSCESTILSELFFTADGVKLDIFG